ncbi:MAG: hypothetical protein AB7K37_11355 [Cyclobacteriaceae bacterium]
MIWSIGGLPHQPTTLSPPSRGGAKVAVLHGGHITTKAAASAGTVGVTITSALYQWTGIG